MPKIYIPKMNGILLRSVTEYISEYRKGFQGRPGTVKELVLDFMNWLMVQHHISQAEVEESLMLNLLVPECPNPKCGDSNWRITKEGVTCINCKKELTLAEWTALPKPEELKDVANTR
jgi:hypothetical protein